MSNIPALIAILSNNDIIASELSSNFDVISQAINSQALNSDNYGLVSILSQHIANDAIVTAKITDAQLTEAKLLHTQASSGVKVLRLGPDSGGGAGIRQALVTHSHSVTAVETATFTGNWSLAARGDPAFQVVPEPTGIVILCPGEGEFSAHYLTIASNSYKILLSVVQSVTDTTQRDLVLYATVQGQV